MTHRGATRSHPVFLMRSTGHSHPCRTTVYRLGSTHRFSNATPNCRQSDNSQRCEPADAFVRWLGKSDTCRLFSVSWVTFISFDVGCQASTSAAFSSPCLEGQGSSRAAFGKHRPGDRQAS